MVKAGPIASWFEQPGLGTQFVAYDTVVDLIGGGYIRRMYLSEYVDRTDYAADYLPAPTRMRNSDIDCRNREAAAEDLCGRPVQRDSQEQDTSFITLLYLDRS